MEDGGRWGSPQATTAANHIPRAYCAQMGLSPAPLSLSDLPATSDLRGENDPDEMPYPMTTPIKHMGIGERTCACVGGGRRAGLWGLFPSWKNQQSTRRKSSARRLQPVPVCVIGFGSMTIDRARSLHSEGLLIQLNPNADHCAKRLNSADSQKSNSNRRFLRTVKWSGSR